MKKLLKRFLLGKASPAETEQVNEWYDAADKNTPMPWKNEASKDAVKERIFSAILNEVNKGAVIIPFYKKRIFLSAVAAVLFLLASAWTIYFIGHNADTKALAVKKASTTNDVKAPESNKSVLVLANGQKIVLDTTADGTLAVQGDVNVVKNGDGQLLYKGESDELAYNTLYVPRGSKPMKLALADGTNVWLNVASSITFPVAFTKNERKVEITGEAYFEVAKDKTKPFIVKKSGSDAEVKVLGTHFNVNAYEDQSVVKVSLLEGAVQLSANTRKALLAPGQQGRIAAGSITTISNVDMTEVMAWKDGLFYFDGADMASIIGQIEKWYNVDVEYNGDINSSFVAKISRDVNVSELLRIFEMTDLVHFKIEGRKIYVTK